MRYNRELLICFKCAVRYISLRLQFVVGVHVILMGEMPTLQILIKATKDY